MLIRNWPAAPNRFSIEFEDRMPNNNNLKTAAKDQLHKIPDTPGPSELINTTPSVSSFAL